MTLREIRLKKSELAIKISEEIVKFEKETNVQVSDIGLDIHEIKKDTGEVFARIISVDIYLKNPCED